MLLSIYIEFCEEPILNCISTGNDTSYSISTIIYCEIDWSLHIYILLVIYTLFVDIRKNEA